MTLGADRGIIGCLFVHPSVHWVLWRITVIRKVVIRHNWFSDTGHRKSWSSVLTGVLLGVCPSVHGVLWQITWIHKLAMSCNWFSGIGHRKSWPCVLTGVLSGVCPFIGDSEKFTRAVIVVNSGDWSWAIDAFDVLLTTKAKRRRIWT